MPTFQRGKPRPRVVGFLAQGPPASRRPVADVGRGGPLPSGRGGVSGDGLAGPWEPFLQNKEATALAGAPSPRDSRVQGSDSRRRVSHLTPPPRLEAGGLGGTDRP